MSKDIYDFTEDIVVETSDVASEIEKVAKEFNIPIAKIDFDIQQVKTFELDTSSNSDWIELEGGLLKKFEEDSYIANPNLQIQQIYTIRIFPKDEFDDPLRDSITHLTTNQDQTALYFVIEKGSELHYRSTLNREIIDHINKLKLLNRYLINIRENGFREKIDQFLSKKIPVLEENFILQVGKCLPPTPQIDDKLELLYKKEFLEQRESSSGRIDHAQKGKVIAVSKGETIIRYTKPQQGKEGRNCRGRTIPVEPPKIENRPDFKVSDNIEIVEDETKIDFVAKIDGNVVFDGTKYDIETEIHIGSLSFKETGYIDAGLDRDIEIDVAETDAVKDAIGTGVKVRVSTLNIEGNVGENAEVTAKEVKIEGQTHQKSTITTDTASIAVHKGKLFGKDVEIERLETGFIEADTIRVETAIGGTLRGKEIYIENLHSHLKIFASKKVEIQNILGSENFITIDLEGHREGVNEIEETKQLLTETSQRIEYLQRVLKEDLDNVIERRKIFTFANKRLERYKKYDVPPPKSLTDKIAKLQDFLEGYKTMKEELKEKKEELEKYQEKLKEFESAIFDAEIVVYDTWKGWNKIIFKLVNSDKKLEKIITEESKEARFRLAEVMYEDGEFEIITDILDEVVASASSNSGGDGEE